MKFFYGLLLAVMLIVVALSNNALAQTTTNNNKPAPSAGQVMEQYRQRTQQDFGNMQQQINTGLSTMRQTLQNAQVTYDGRVIVANDTLDVVTPIQNMAEGILKAAEGIDVNPEDLNGVRTAITTMPFLLKGGLDMLKTVFPNNNDEQK